MQLPECIRSCIYCESLYENPLDYNVIKQRKVEEYKRQFFYPVISFTIISIIFLVFTLACPLHLRFRIGNVSNIYEHQFVDPKDFPANTYIMPVGTMLELKKHISVLQEEISEFTRVQENRHLDRIHKWAELKMYVTDSLLQEEVRRYREQLKLRMIVVNKQPFPNARHYYHFYHFSYFFIESILALSLTLLTSVIKKFPVLSFKTLFIFMGFCAGFTIYYLIVVYLT